MVIQGEVDAVVSARNGQAAARAWADAAGASAVAERAVRRGNRYSMTVTDFKRKGRTMSTLVQVDSLGHAWSGGGRTNCSVTARARMLRAWPGHSRCGSSLVDDPCRHARRHPGPELP
jgi:hypothetical protein